MKSMMAMSMVLVLTLAGCSETGTRMGADTDEGAAGTAQVREMDAGMRKEMPGNMNDAMVQCDQMMMRHMGEADENYDRRFIDMMSRHHEGAIRMAEDALENARHPQIKQFARKVIDQQQKEIKQLQAWEKQWYGKTASSEQTGPAGN